jgi:DNA-binding GntR family transcriptional regulator
MYQPIAGRAGARTESASMLHLPALLSAPAPSENHTEAAYRTIKRRIIELDLAPGSQFSENELARLAGVSKTPVRGALARLQRDGLVEPFPRSGYRVRAITLRSTMDLCGFRSIIEPKAAELAATHGLSEATLSRLRLLATHSLSSPYHGSPELLEEYLHRNFEFDSLIANGSGNERLAAAIVAVFDDLERVLRLILKMLPWSETFVEERLAIVDAIERREGAAAHDAMLRRTQSSQKEIVGTLLSSSALTDANIVLATAK